jgi:seryl-tRNA synthetase
MWSDAARIFRTERGLATFGPEGIELCALLKRLFGDWELACGIQPRQYPPLLRAEDLGKFDYFQNFPHLALCVSNLNADHVAEYGSQRTPDMFSAIPREHLTDSEYLLPSAACYPIYLELSGDTLTKPVYLGVLATCYRNECEYSGLTRLRAFSMQEFVCVGDVDSVRMHLEEFRKRTLHLVEAVGLPIGIHPAVDSFYDTKASRALMQKLFPVKEEFVYDERVAIASLNFHRNFFGERCGIRLTDGSFAFSCCVAFGVERWIHSLLDHFDGDLSEVRRALQQAGTP